MKYCENLIIVLGMETLGFKSDTVDGLWLCLALVLLLGDLEVNIIQSNDLIICEILFRFIQMIIIIFVL